MFAQEITAQGSLNFNVPGFLVGTGDSTVQARKLTQDLNLVKIGVNYHFSPIPTVVTARY
jgi:hypothetical protein